jgi:CHAD domain-containing protein
MLERELKLNAPADFRIPDLSVSNLESVAAARRFLDAVYFDTADLRLARWGCSLRHRTDEGWTIKLPLTEDRDLQQRNEVTFQGRWDEVPVGAVALVRGFTRGARLVQIARLRTVRRPVLLIDRLGRCLAEVVDDDVSTYRGEGPAGRFREIEIELADGTDQELINGIVTALQDAGAGAVTRLSKLARALGAPALSDADVVVADASRDATAAEVVRAAFARSVHRFITHMPGVHLGEDPEALHQARVGTRRLRSDLRTFGPLLEEGWVMPLRDELRWLGAALGTVRDIDVLAQRLTSTAEQLPPAEASAQRLMMKTLEMEREARRRELLAGIDGHRYVELLDAMVDAANQPQILPAAQQPGGMALTELARIPFERLQQTVEDLPENPEDEYLHRIRIWAKRVRYAAEAIAPVVGKKARRFAAAAADLQDTLGELQDATVAHAWLAQLADLNPALAFAAGQLAGLELVRSEQSRRRWKRKWDVLCSQKLRSWM